MPMPSVDTLSVPDASPFSQGAEALTSAGYHCIPINPKEKRPHPKVGSRWQRFKIEAANPELLEAWCNFPNAGLGIVLGSEIGEHQLIALDIDTDDPDEIDEILRALPHTPMGKKGLKGLTRFYRAPKSLKSQQYKTYDGRHLADLLTGNETKQTVVPPSLHPSGVAYSWIGRVVPPHELPILSHEALQAFEETLQTFGLSAEQRHSVPQTGDDPFSEVKIEALARLSEWVPHLNLQRLTRSPDGYRAVAHWRASANGRAIEDRGRNLSITSSGIRDHGADTGYSAIDLVMAALGLENHQACNWLEAKLGLNTAEIIDLSTRLEKDPKPSDEKFDELPPCPLANEIVKWIEESAPFTLRLFSVGAAFSLISTAVGRQYCTPEQNGGLNLFILGLAPSGSGKNHPLNAIKQVLAHQDLVRNLGPSTWTAASVLEKELVASPVLLSAIDEYGDALKKMTRRNTTIAEESKIRTIKELFSIGVGSYQTQSMAMSSRQTIEAPHFSMFAAATPQMLYGNLTTDLIEGGFLNRWLILNEQGRTKKRSLQEELARRQRTQTSLVDGAERISELLVRLKRRRGDLVDARAVGSSFKIEPVAAKWGDLALERWLQYQIDTTDGASEKGEDYVLFFSRAAEIALRLATLIGIANQIDEPEAPIIVEKGAVDWAIQFVDQAMQKTLAEASAFTHQSALAALRDRLLKYVKSRDGWISHSQISRAQGRQFDDARQLAAQLDFLVEAGELRKKEEKSSGGGRILRSYCVATA